MAGTALRHLKKHSKRFCRCCAVSHRTDLDDLHTAADGAFPVHVIHSIPLCVPDADHQMHRRSRPTSRVEHRGITGLAFRPHLGRRVGRAARRRCDADRHPRRADLSSSRRARRCCFAGAVCELDSSAPATSGLPGYLTTLILTVRARSWRRFRVSRRRRHRSFTPTSQSACSRIGGCRWYGDGRPASRRIGCDYPAVASAPETRGRHFPAEVNMEQQRRKEVAHDRTIRPSSRRRLLSCSARPLDRAVRRSRPSSGRRDRGRRVRDRTGARGRPGGRILPATDFASTTTAIRSR